MIPSMSGPTSRPRSLSSSCSTSTNRSPPKPPVLISASSEPREVTPIPGLENFSVFEIGKKLFDLNIEINQLGKNNHEGFNIITTALIRKITNTYQKYIFDYKVIKTKENTIPDITWNGFQKLVAIEGLHQVYTSLRFYSPNHPMLGGLNTLINSNLEMIHEQLYISPDEPNTLLLKNLEYGEKYINDIFTFDHTPHKQIANFMLFNLIRTLRSISHEKTIAKTSKFIQNFIIADLLINFELVKNNDSFNNRENLFKAFDLLNYNFNSPQSPNGIPAIRTNTLKLTPFDNLESIQLKIHTIKELMDIFGFTTIIERGRTPQPTSHASSSSSSKNIKFDFSEITRLPTGSKIDLERIIIELEDAYLSKQNMEKCYIHLDSLKSNETYSSQCYTKMTDNTTVKTITFATIPTTQSLHSYSRHKQSLLFDLANFQTCDAQFPLDDSANLFYSEGFVKDSARCVYVIADKVVRCSFSLSEKENQQIIQQIFSELEERFSKGEEFLKMTNYLHQMSSAPACELIKSCYDKKYPGVDLIIGHSPSHPFFFKAYQTDENTLIYRIALIYHVYAPNNSEIPEAFHVQITDMRMSPDQTQVLSAHYISEPFTDPLIDPKIIGTPSLSVERHLREILMKGLEFLRPWQALAQTEDEDDA